MGRKTVSTRFQVVVRRIPVGYSSVRQLIDALYENSSEFNKSYGHLNLASFTVAFLAGKKSSESRMARPGFWELHLKNRAEANTFCKLVNGMQIPSDPTVEEVATTKEEDDLSKKVENLIVDNVAVNIVGDSNILDENRLNDDLTADDGNLSENKPGFISMSTIFADVSIFRKIRIPTTKSSSRRKLKVNTIESDIDFKRFLEYEKRPVQKLPSAETQLDNGELDNDANEATPVAALALYLANKEERKKIGKESRRERRRRKRLEKAGVSAGKVKILSKKDTGQDVKEEAPKLSRRERSKLKLKEKRRQRRKEKKELLKQERLAKRKEKGNEFPKKTNKRRGDRRSKVDGETKNLMVLTGDKNQVSPTNSVGKSILGAGLKSLAKKKDYTKVGDAIVGEAVVLGAPSKVSNMTTTSAVVDNVSDGVPRNPEKGGLKILKRPS